MNIVIINGPVTYKQKLWVNEAPKFDFDNAESKTESETGDGIRITLSDKSKELNQASQEVAKAKEVRRDRVAELKKAVNEGYYKIDAEKIASRMIASV